MKLQQKHFNIAAVASLVIALFLGAKALLFSAPADQPVARSGGFATNCYAANGSTWTADSGCTWNVKSGGTLQIDSGASVAVAADTVSTGDLQGRNITATAQISTAKLLIGASTTVNNLTFGSGVGASASDAGTIAHGMGVTPTLCLLSQAGANTITRTVLVSSLDATNITIAATLGNTATVKFACFK